MACKTAPEEHRHGSLVLRADGYRWRNDLQDRPSVMSMKSGRIIWRRSFARHRDQHRRAGAEPGTYIRSVGRSPIDQKGEHRMMTFLRDDGERRDLTERWR